MKTNLQAGLLIASAFLNFSGCERKTEYCEFDGLTGKKIYCVKLTEAEYKVANAKDDVVIIREAILRYALDLGQIPSQEQGIGALITPPEGINISRYPPHGYLERIVDDPWGNPYQYVVPAQRSDDAFDVFSFGPDGKPNTSDDIGNWN